MRRPHKMHGTSHGASVAQTSGQSVLLGCCCVKSRWRLFRTSHHWFKESGAKADTRTAPAVRDPGRRWPALPAPPGPAGRAAQPQPSRESGTAGTAAPLPPALPNANALRFYLPPQELKRRETRFDKRPCQSPRRKATLYRRLLESAESERLQPPPVTGGRGRATPGHPPLSAVPSARPRGRQLRCSRGPRSRSRSRARPALTRRHLPRPCPALATRRPRAQPAPPRYGAATGTSLAGRQNARGGACGRAGARLLPRSGLAVGARGVRLGPGPGPGPAAAGARSRPEPVAFGGCRGLALGARAVEGRGPGRGPRWSAAGVAASAKAGALRSAGRCALRGSPSRRTRGLRISRAPVSSRSGVSRGAFRPALERAARSPGQPGRERWRRGDAGCGVSLSSAAVRARKSRNDLPLPGPAEEKSVSPPPARVPAPQLGRKALRGVFHRWIGECSSRESLRQMSLGNKVAQQEAELLPSASPCLLTPLFPFPQLSPT